MKTFLKRILLFSFYLFVVSILISIVYPKDKFYGNSNFQDKLELINDSEVDFNYFFFGSSRVATGVNPIVFDSLAHLNNIKANSFNIATYGSWSLENFYLFNEFVKEKDLKNVVIFMEFQNVMSIQWNKIDTDKNIYYHNLNTLEQILKYTKGFNSLTIRNVLKQAHYIFSHSLSTLANYYNIGYADTYFEIENQIEKEFDKRGFKGLKGETKISSNLQKYKSSVNQGLPKVSEDQANIGYLKIINEILEISADRDIDLIFFLTPKSYTQPMLNVYNIIPTENKTPISFLLRKDDFYNNQYWADGRHLNTLGANLFTKSLFDEYILFIND